MVRVVTIMDLVTKDQQMVFAAPPL